MLDSDIDQVVKAKQRFFVCCCCKTTVGRSEIAAWIRTKRGAVFDPMCVDCLWAVFGSAKESMEFQVSIEELFK